MSVSLSLSLSSQKLWIKEVGSDVAVLRVDISVERLMTTISSVAGSSLLQGFVSHITESR